MKITIEAGSLDELRSLLEGLNTAAQVNAAPAEKTAFAKAQEPLAALKAEAEAEAAPVAAAEPQPELTDLQRAVRELVMAKGKATALAVLEEFGANKASNVKVEDYSAVIEKLKEALND